MFHAPSTKQSVRSELSAAQLARRLPAVWARADRLDDIHAAARGRGDRRRARQAARRAFDAAIALEDRILALPGRSIADAAVHAMILGSRAACCADDPARDANAMAQLATRVRDMAIIIAKAAKLNLKSVGGREYFWIGTVPRLDNKEELSMAKSVGWAIAV